MWLLLLTRRKFSSAGENKKQRTKNNQTNKQNPSMTLARYHEDILQTVTVSYPSSSPRQGLWNQHFLSVCVLEGYLLSYPFSTLQQRWAHFTDKETISKRRNHILRSHGEVEAEQDLGHHSSDKLGISISSLDGWGSRFLHP